MKKVILLSIAVIMMLMMNGCGEGIKGKQKISGIPENETNMQEPPVEDYDEIILCDERYYLCKKAESGFDVNTTYFGIYDNELGKWTLEFCELPVNVENPEFYNHGNGVFSFSFIKGGGSEVCFLSSDLGGYFIHDVINEYAIHYVNGKAFVLLYEESKNQGGKLTPNNRLYLMSTLGELEEVSIAGFEADEAFYWDEASICEVRDTTLYAKSFGNYISGKRKTYIFVYFYGEGKYTIIDNEEYNNRLRLCVGSDFSTNSIVSLQEDLIQINRLQGDDGKEYYAEFDKEGNLVTKATLMY